MDGDGDGGGEGDGCEERDGDAEKEEEEDTAAQPVFRFRGNDVITPAATNPANRRQIRPHGDWQWDDICWEGRNRLRPVNATLETLCRFHYPGMVKLQSDDQGVTTAERYRLSEGEEQCLQARARSVFDKAATKVVRDMMSNARIQCVCLYYKKKKQQDMNKKLGASEIYLREDEYLQVDISGLL
ncbi:hypothetical protein PAHAL_2G112800 [Panicum hallii]|uniref:Uncharacterized protein n=1 Tax=Panicum hallii TaxID=206008 RepID=A0A2T8KNQ9_9POAL|nr:hypothetical protein PAHAL_2G112800 [Panicum hallii]